MKAILGIALLLISCGPNEQAAIISGEGSSRDGRDGKDGQGCVVEDSEDGAVIVCGNQKQNIFDGINGKDGTNGRDGIDGEQGEQGESGIDGLQGKKGDQGESGEPGEQGPAGVETLSVWVESSGGEWIGDLLLFESTEAVVYRDEMRFRISLQTGVLLSTHYVYFPEPDCEGQGRVNASTTSTYLVNVFKDPENAALVYKTGERDSNPWDYVSVMSQFGGPCLNNLGTLSKSREASHIVLPFEYPVVSPVIEN